MFSLILPLCNPTTIARFAATETMPVDPSDLEDLRRQLDGIDDKVHDLLIERAGIVAAIAASKQHSRQAAFQPAREAQIVRRLAGRHRGPLPLANLVRIWREMLAATVRLQSPFAVAVYAPTEAPGYWDLARDHFGSHSAMTAFGSIGQVIRAVADRNAALGILPMPDESDVDPWWRHLVSEGEAAPRVVARLPFGARGNARSDGADALAVGCFPQQPTGDDRTLFVTETAAGISRARIFGILSGLGLECTFFATFEPGPGAVNLVEVAGFVPLDDPRLDGFREQLGSSLHRLLAFGGYAVPLPATTFGAGAKATPSRAAGARRG
jgi:chorismate mutase / prephenate dehydratase